MKRPSARRKPWQRLVAAVAVVLVLLGVGAAVTGQVGYVITDGISMEPLYHTGDLVVIERASWYHIGEIVAYHGDLDGHTVVLHRIVGGNATSGFLMKGDNNHSIDPLHPTGSQVIGRAVLHIPKVGLALKSPELRGLLALVVLVTLFSLFVEPRRKPLVKPRQPPATQPQPAMGAEGGRSVVSPLLRPSVAASWGGNTRLPPPATSGAWVGNVSPLLRSSASPALARPMSSLGPRSGVTTPPLVSGMAPSGQRRAPAPWLILAGLTVLVGAALALSLVVGSSQAPPGPSPFTQTGALAYYARTPPSVAYPSGRIVTGDPVFLKLVNRLHISYFYSTDAPVASVRGTVRLTAVVSGGNGWQMSLPLVGAARLKNARADLDTTLDLARIEAIATQVAQSTQVYLGSLTVTVTAVANVSFDGTRPVTSKVVLPLSLSALELSAGTGGLTHTAHGPAITSSSPLNPAPPPARPSTLPHKVRLGLIGLLLLLIAATVAAIPSSEPEERREPQEG